MRHESWEGELSCSNYFNRLKLGCGSTVVRTHNEAELVHTYGYVIAAISLELGFLPEKLHFSFDKLMDSRRLVRFL